VIYHRRFDFEISTDEIILIDEIDQFIFDDPEQFNSFTKYSNVIGFTATRGSKSHQSHENKIYSDLQLTDYCFDPFEGVLEQSVNIKREISVDRDA
jgi:hypothetical protein